MLPLDAVGMVQKLDNLTVALGRANVNLHFEVTSEVVCSQVFALARKFV